MRRTFLKHVAGGVFAAMLAELAAPACAADPIKVVYHLTEGIDQATRALSNIRNHLRADPDVRITVVANGDGIRFLLQGAKDRAGKPFDAAVAALVSQGVEFLVCSNTLIAHDIAQSSVLPQAKLTPSGVVEVARLQAREGFVYLRP